RFAGKTVVVLGGNSGIGLAAARAFQAEGARVAITGRNEATLAQVAAESGMLAVRSDMGSVADSRAALARIADRLGGIAVLHAHSRRRTAAATDPRQRRFARSHGDRDLQARRQSRADRSGAFQPGRGRTDETYGQARRSGTRGAVPRFARGELHHRCGPERRR